MSPVRPRASWLLKLTTCLALSVAGAAALGSVASASGSTGSIAGTVTAASGNADLSGVCAEAYFPDNTNNAVGDAITAANGTYTITGLTAGSYDIEFSPTCGNGGNYLSQWYDDETSPASADEVPVTAGDTTSPINAALATGGSISGVVTAQSGGATLAGVCVDVNEIGGTSFGSTATVAGGTYAISGLTSGSYQVEFFVGCGNGGNYLPQWYDLQGSESSANAVSVDAGDVSPSIDASLITGGAITGTVTAASGGAPLSGICVDASQVGGSAFESATTTANGSYSITELGTGSWDVEFSPDCGNGGDYLSQWYDNESSAAVADPITIDAGTTVASVNAAMYPPGGISGTVTAVLGGAPVSGICVNATEVGGSSTGFAITAGDGTYAISGLPTGSYDVEFSPGCGNSGSYFDQWYDNEASAATADAVQVQNGNTTGAVDAALITGGTITGTVTAASGGADLSGICVAAYSVGDPFVPVTTVSTESNGTYAIAGLAAGQYDVEFSTGCGSSGNYGQQWYNGAISFAGASVVTVTSGGVTPTINAALSAGGSITGTVRAVVGGADLSGICVSAYPTDDLQLASATAVTGPSGIYAITDLAPGDYNVEFVSGCGNAGSLGQQWYQNQISQSAAASVPVAAGVTTPLINGAMTASGSISGTVSTAEGGPPLAGICVNAYAPGDSVFSAASAATTIDGTYTLVDLAPGNYDVEFSAGCGNSTIVGQQWYSGQEAQATANPVTVAAGATTGSVNAALATTGTITGTVKAATGGTDLTGICVEVYPPDDPLSPVGSAVTAIDGTYEIAGITPGSYDVYFYSGCGNNGNYGQQWYDVQTSQSEAGIVQVAAGVTTQSINATLQPPGTITGTVTAANGGADLSGVCVNAYAPGDTVFSSSSAITGPDGTYQLTGLAPSSYSIEFSAECGASDNYVSQWYSNSPTEALADPVPAAALSTTASINAALVAPLPVVTSVSPSSGSTAGGTSVIVSGSNLGGASTVSFGATPAVVTADTLDSVTVTTPAESPGLVDVTVTTAGGTSATSPADHYTFVTPSPVVTGVNPSTGSTGGGTTVTVTGTNLAAASTVSFGATPGVITADSSTALTVTSPTQGAGTVDVTVTTPGGTSATSPADHYAFVAPPTVTAVLPASGPSSGGTPVTISGSNLSAATTVLFGVTPGTITADSATSITATAPAQTAGTVDVTVTTPGGTSVTLPADRFTFMAAPTVTGVSPAGGPTAGDTAVLITGDNLVGATTVKFGATAATITADSATSITATSPPEVAGTIDVTVTTAGGTSTTSPADQFTFAAAPAVTAISPAAGPVGGGTPVTVTGTDLGAASSVKFGATLGTITADTATTLTAVSPAGSSGVAAVTVTTAGGTSVTSPADRFTYVAAPTVTGVSPATGPSSGGTAVTITGTNLANASSVEFGTVPATVTADSPGSVTATSPLESAGTVDVTVTTSGGTSATSPAGQFTLVAQPVVTGLTPSGGPTGGGTAVTISGSNLGAATSVHFGTVLATVTADQAGSITATSPAEPVGAVNVTVTTIGGTSAVSPADTFTYEPPPTVAAISPADGSTTGGTTVTITGSNLSGATTVSFGTVPGTVTADSSTSVTATSPVGSAGTVDVTVTTTVGTSPTTLADRFTFVTPPMVTGVSPTTGSTVGGTAVTIAGASLGEATAVMFGSIAATITADSATSVTATAPAQGAGSVDVTVTTPGGPSPTSTADQFTYMAPQPAVTGVSPSTGSTAGGTSVTVTGTNLASATAVAFGSAAGTVTADSATSISVTSPAGTAGAVDVTVTTAGGTSATSVADLFTFVSPSAGGGVYTSLSPVRICDTRAGNPSNLTGDAAQCNGFENFGSPIASLGSKTINVTQGFGIPTDATSVVLNVTVVNPQTAGYLTVFPAGVSPPVASNVNYVAGEAVPNLVQVGVGAGGDVSLYSSAHTDVVVDAEGYTSPTTQGGAGLYTPLSSPARICDTRPDDPSNLLSAPDNQCDGLDNSGETLAAKGTVNVQVTGGNGVPTGASAAIVNVTVANPAAGGYLTVYPDGVATPFASNVNYTAGEVTANRVIVPLSTGGGITVYSSARADVIVDISGYYSGTGGSGTEFSPESSPVRICDSRPGNPSGLTGTATQCDGQTIGAGKTLTLQVTGLAGVPADAKAVVINLTGVLPTAPTYLTVFPGPSRPFASDLNPPQGGVQANLTVATLSSSGTISIYNSAGSINVVVDVLGWYS